MTHTNSCAVVQFKSAQLNRKFVAEPYFAHFILGCKPSKNIQVCIQEVWTPLCAACRVFLSQLNPHLLSVGDNNNNNNIQLYFRLCLISIYWYSAGQTTVCLKTWKFKRSISAASEMLHGQHAWNMSPVTRVIKKKKELKFLRHVLCRSKWILNHMVRWLQVAGRLPATATWSSVNIQRKLSVKLRCDHSFTFDSGYYLPRCSVEWCQEAAWPETEVNSGRVRHLCQSVASSGLRGPEVRVHSGNTNLSNQLQFYLLYCHPLPQVGVSFRVWFRVETR